MKNNALLCTVKTNQHFTIMTTAIHTELETLAKEIFAHVAQLGGESETFDAYAGDYSAEVRYTATIGEDRGDYYTAPSWWIEEEDIEVLAVYDGEGDENKEAARLLARMLH